MKEIRIEKASKEDRERIREFLKSIKMKGGVRFTKIFVPPDKIIEI